MTIEGWDIARVLFIERSVVLGEGTKQKTGG
jgi:hypothetical protein